MLRRLAARGLIDLRYRSIIVRDPGAMHAFVDEG